MHQHFELTIKVELQSNHISYELSNETNCKLYPGSEHQNSRLNFKNFRFFATNCIQISKACTVLVLFKRSFCRKTLRLSSTFMWCQKSSWLIFGQMQSFFLSNPKNCGFHDHIEPVKLAKRFSPFKSIIRYF